MHGDKLEDGAKSEQQACVRRVLIPSQPVDWSTTVSAAPPLRAFRSHSRYRARHAPVRAPSRSLAKLGVLPQDRGWRPASH